MRIYQVTKELDSKGKSGHGIELESASDSKESIKSSVLGSLGVEGSVEEGDRGGGIDLAPVSDSGESISSSTVDVPGAKGADEGKEGPGGIDLTPVSDSEESRDMPIKFTKADESGGKKPSPGLKITSEMNIPTKRELESDEEKSDSISKKLSGGMDIPPKPLDLQEKGEDSTSEDEFTGEELSSGTEQDIKAPGQVAEAQESEDIKVKVLVPSEAGGQSKTVEKAVDSTKTHIEHGPWISSGKAARMAKGGRRRKATGA